jgi:hypothetical protein
VRRLKASEFAELRRVGEAMVEACGTAPGCAWSQAGADQPVAPTLAKFVDPDEYARTARAELAEAARALLPAASGEAVDEVEVLKPEHSAAEIVATLLYPVTDRPFGELYRIARGWSEAQRREVLDAATRSRTRRDELLRGFRGGLYCFDLVLDIGAYRDLHRHRRCQQYRQAYGCRQGFSVPEPGEKAGIGDLFRGLYAEVQKALAALPAPAGQYLLPFAARSRFLFKMDFAEAEYLTRLRSGVKGHFSYRKAAWLMKEKLAALEPELAHLLEATPPWVEDPLRR